jgi:hypothetical protein
MCARERNIQPFAGQRAKVRSFYSDKYVRKMPIPQNGLSQIDASIPS